jgi:hypothetical protein
MVWDLLYRAAYDLALAGCPDVRAVSRLFELGGADRSAFEAARLHYVGHLAGGTTDMDSERAARYIESALRVGDDRRRWEPSAASVDPWDFARHRMAPVTAVA